MKGRSNNSYSILQPSWEFIFADKTRIYINQQGKVIDDPSMVPWYETYVFPPYNPQTVEVKPNILVRENDWSLSVTKVQSLGGAQGKAGRHTPFQESDEVRSYFVWCSIENAVGKDKAFLPRDEVLGIVGISGKFYEFYQGTYKSLDE
jgi:hypothetical protein